MNKELSETLSLTLSLQSHEETVALGERLGAQLKKGAIIYLDGNLGAGKTTLCQGILKSFNYSGAVKSPTYTLVEPYDFAGFKVYHFDLYRLGDAQELEYFGIRDYFFEPCVCLVEWFERGEGVLPKEDIRIVLTPDGEGRKAELYGASSLGQNIIENI